MIYIYIYIYISPYTVFFFKPYEQAGKELDITVSIDSVEALGHILDRLTTMVTEDELDDYELIPDYEWEWDTEYYYFKPETVEKLIRKHFLPTFNISSIDYTKSEYWDSEKTQFKVLRIYDMYIGGIDVYYYYLKESGYKIGDYYYVSLVPLEDYPNAYKAFTFGFMPEDKYMQIQYPHMRHITSEYFDIPRVTLKFKKFVMKNEQGESWDTYIPVGFKPVDERPGWVKTAAKLLSALKEYDNYSSGIQTGVGVMDGDLGKRMYISYFSEMGLRHYTRCDGFMTFGLRGENDIISFVSILDSNIITYPGTDTEDMRMREIVSNGTTIHDNFNGETYSYCSTHDSDEGDSIKYTLNEKEITKEEFDSARVVAYFKGIGSSEEDISTADEIPSIYSISFNDFTLASLYDIARIMTD